MTARRTARTAGGDAAGDGGGLRSGTPPGLAARLGARPAAEGGVAGLRFAVWVPGASAVQVTGECSGWDATAHPLARRDDGSDVWEGFVPGAFPGMRYRYRVTGADGLVRPEQVDPLAFTVTGPGGACSTAGWPSAARRAGGGAPGRGPIALYQVHLDGWRRVPEEGNRPLTYREAGGWLAAHLRETGFTGVELLPTPGAQAPAVAGFGNVGFLAPPGGQGDAADFGALLDALHEAGAGVVLRRHLAPEELGLLERPEAFAILLAAAAAWLDAGVDGLRLELPLGADGGLAAASARFVAALGEEIATRHPGALLVLGGDRGSPRAVPPGAPAGTRLWRADWEGRTREYLALDPIHRSHRHDLVVQGIEEVRGVPALLPLSCGGGRPPGSALLAGLWGDERQRLAHLRLLLGYAWACPGAKLLFMGGEFGQSGPRRLDGSLDWHLLGEAPHRQVLRWVAHLNIRYRGEPALAEEAGEGFAWVDAGDRDQSVVCFERRAAAPAATFLAVCNFTPVPRANYRVGVSRGGYWAEALNSDAGEYGGWGMGNLGGAEATPVPFHGRRHSVSLVLPPLALLLLRSPA